MSKLLILCDCAASQKPDAAAIGKACDVECSRVFSALCTDQIGQAADLIASGDAIVACGQEQAVFEDLAEELGVETPGFVDIRDRAGWSDEAEKAGPKMAALVAESLQAAHETRAIDVVSQGTCLIAGPGEVVLPLADRLSSALAVTALIADSHDLPVTRAYDAIRGRVRRVTGALAGFEVQIDALQQLNPSGRGTF